MPDVPGHKEDALTLDIPFTTASTPAFLGPGDIRPVTTPIKKMFVEPFQAMVDPSKWVAAAGDVGKTAVAGVGSSIDILAASDEVIGAPLFEGINRALYDPLSRLEWMGLKERDFSYWKPETLEALKDFAGGTINFADLIDQLARQNETRALGEQIALGIIDPIAVLGTGKAAIRAVKTGVEENARVYGPPAVEKFNEMMLEAKRVIDEGTSVRSAEMSKRTKEVVKAQTNPSLTATQAFIQAQSKLKGKLPVDRTMTKLEEFITPAELDEMFDFIRYHPDLTPLEVQRAQGALFDMMNGLAPQEAQAALLAEVFGPGFEKGLRHFMGNDTAWRNFAELYNLPKTLKATFDLSAPFRQGFILGSGHPVKAGQAFWKMMRAASSEEGYREIVRARRNHPQFDDYTKAFSKKGDSGDGLFYADLNKIGALTQREEVFISRMAERIPIVGKGVKISERAYVTFLNELRFSVFDDIIQGAVKAGKPMSKAERHDLARFLNAATGRGTLGRFEEYAPILSAPFFSLRLAVSRFEVPLLALNPHTTARVRKEMARNIVASMVTVGSIMGIAKLAWGDEIEIETDPRSSDYGKIRHGNTRLDFTAGYGQIIRFAVRLAENETKGVHSGFVSEAEYQKIIGQFLRSKLSPVAGKATDIFRQDDFLGDPIRFGRQGILDHAVDVLFPLMAEDIIEALREEGLVGGLMASTAFVGVGSLTIPEREVDKARRAVLTDEGMELILTSLPALTDKQKKDIQQQINGYLTGNLKWANVAENVRGVIDAHPTVQEQKDAADQIAIERGGLWGKYIEEKIRYNTEAEDDIAVAAGMYKHGKLYRKRVRAINMIRYDRLDQLAFRNEELLSVYDQQEISDDFNIAIADYRERLQDPTLEDPDTGDFDFERRDQIIEDLKSKYPVLFPQIQDHVHRNETPLARELREDRETLKKYLGTTMDLAKIRGLDQIYKKYLLSTDKQGYLQQNPELKPMFVDAGRIKSAIRLGDADIFRLLWKWEYIDPHRDSEALWHRQIWVEVETLRAYYGGTVIPDRGLIMDIDLRRPGVKPLPDPKPLKRKIGTSTPEAPIKFPQPVSR
jgi:hypothetical protein